jgi:hypothetical protein
MNTHLSIFVGSLLRQRHMVTGRYKEEYDNRREQMENLWYLRDVVVADGNDD